MTSPRPTPRRWTADEQKQMDHLLEAGKTVVEIAPALQRIPAKRFMRNCSAFTESDPSRPPAGRAR
jgi:hypothetical protein